MIELHELTGRLASWAPTEDPEANYGRIMTHPEFASAMRALFRGKARAVTENRLLIGLFRDAGHYLATLWALSLDAEGRLTLPQLKSVCSASGLLSPGRSRALLIYLQHVGYVVCNSPDRGAMPALYAATPRFLEDWNRHLCDGLRAASPIEPRLRALIARMESNHEVARLFARYHGDTILRAICAVPIVPSPPLHQVFHERAGGGMVFSLLMSETGTDWKAPIIHSIADLAAQSGVSRTHIKRMFRDAEREDLLRRDGHHWAWSERARHHISFLCALEFAVLLSTAATTVFAASFDKGVTADRSPALPL